MTTEFFDFRTEGCLIVHMTLYNGTRLYLNTEFATFLDRVPLFRWMTIGHPGMRPKQVDVVDGFVYLDYRGIFHELSVHCFDILMSCVLGRRPIPYNFMMQQVQNAAECIGAYETLKSEFEAAWEMKHKYESVQQGPHQGAAVVPLEEDSDADTEPALAD
jgi:hypothetical protein